MSREQPNDPPPQPSDNRPRLEDGDQDSHDQAKRPYPDSPDGSDD